MNRLEILTAARARIAQGWTQGEFAKTANGHTAEPNSPHAVSWCSVGALYAAANAFHLGPTAIAIAADHLKESLPCDECHGGITGWNDFHGRTHEEVLAVYDDAIARLR